MPSNTNAAEDSGTSLHAVFEHAFAPFLKPRSMPVTYCDRIMSGARQGINNEGFELYDLWYTASGMCAKVRDPRNGQEYELTVTPLKPIR